VGQSLHATTHHSRPDGTPYPDAGCPIGMLLNEGTEKFGTDHFWRKDGRGFAVEYAATRADELDGQHGVVMAFRDITARQMAEAELRASEEHFRMLAENMADIVWKADRERRFTYINDADRRLRGFAREEVIGHSIEDTLTPEGKEMFARLLERSKDIETQGALRFEIPQRCKDGHAIWLDVLTIPIYDTRGQIAGYQGIGRDITERRRQDAELEQSQRQLEIRLKELAEEKIDLQEQVIQDPLTGINNRRYLNETLPRELARARREGYPLAVIMLDLDHFKKINDTYSHAAGDEVLKSLAALLKRGARESDVICRYGGEEFVVAMPGMSAERALQRIDSWRAELAEMQVQYGNSTIRVTLSAGVAEFPAHGDDMDTLLARADEMLYRSKSEGRNRISVYGTAALT
jgi:diguanylate cyclase (GGDEF)-like protein/PAS domain S-box-containing protein